MLGALPWASCVPEEAALGAIINESCDLNTKLAHKRRARARTAARNEKAISRSAKVLAKNAV